jgi:hypothetical protein
MFFSGFEYHMFYVLYPFVAYLHTLPRNINMEGRACENGLFRNHDDNQ